MPSEQSALGFAACFRRTPACNHPAHRGTFAEVSQLFNLARELTTIAAAICPPLQQIRKERFDQSRDVARAHLFPTRRGFMIQYNPHLPRPENYLHPHLEEMRPP